MSPTVTENLLDGLLEDRNGWKRMPTRDAQELGFYPNFFYQSSERSLMAVVVRQAQKGDWAVSKNALDYIILNLKKGACSEGWVVLADRDMDTIIAYELAKALNQRLWKPRFGQYGPHWWVNNVFSNHNVHNAE